MDFKVIERPTILPRAGGKYETELKAVFDTATSTVKTREGDRPTAVVLDLPSKEHAKFKSSLHYHARKRKLGTRSYKDGEKLVVWAFERQHKDDKKKR